MWAPSGLAEEHRRNDELRGKLYDIEDKGTRMQATFWRLKSRGKSDARCREIVALHLPRGNGPRDNQEVSMFFEQDAQKCKRGYQEDINFEVKNIQKRMIGLRNMRNTLSTSITQLSALPCMRRQEEKEREAKAAQAAVASLKGFGGLGGALKIGRTEEDSGALAMVTGLGERHGLDVNEVQELMQGFSQHAEAPQAMSRKAFGRFMQALQPDAEESAIESWWTSLVTVCESSGSKEAGRKDKAASGRKAARAKFQCSFEQYVGWYAQNH